MGAGSNAQIKGSLVEGLLSATTDAERTRCKKALKLIEEVTFHKAAADAAAGTASELWIARITKKILVNDDVKIIAAASLTADDTNYATVSLEVDDGAGGANTVLASQTTKITGGSGNWVAGTALALTITTTAADRIIDGATATKYLILKIAKTGTGVAVPVSTLFLSHEIVD